MPGKEASADDDDAETPSFLVLRFLKNNRRRWRRRLVWCAQKGWKAHHCGEQNKECWTFLAGDQRFVDDSCHPADEQADIPELWPLPHSSWGLCFVDKCGSILIRNQSYQEKGLA